MLDLWFARLLCMCCIVCDRPDDDDDDRKRARGAPHEEPNERSVNPEVSDIPAGDLAHDAHDLPHRRSHRIKQHDAQTNAPIGRYRLSVTHRHQRILFVAAATRATVQRAPKRVFRHIPQDFNCRRRTTCWIDLHTSMLCHRQMQHSSVYQERSYCSEK